MVTPKFFIASLLVATTSGILAHAEQDIFAVLLKRQDPGTPAYNCHDNCGTAITLSKQADPCNNNAFQTDYNNCLQCAGPDNYNIWMYYGSKLSAVGTACSLATQAKSGKQADVGPALHANASSSAAPTSGGLVPSVSVSQLSPMASANSSSTRVLSAPSLSAASSQGPTSTLASTTSAPPQQSTNAVAHLTAVDIASILGIFLGGSFVCSLRKLVCQA